MAQLARLSEDVGTYDRIAMQVSDARVLLDLAVSEGDQGELSQVDEEVDRLQAEIDRLEVVALLGGATPGDEAGIKSATVTMEGRHAFGLLSAERGVHRLVRISPFDASKRRHTSFASLDVTPEIQEEVEVEIDPDDIRVDTYRSSGAGGQHVNVTDSAVRITHIPSGIVVSCQNERSQHRNRDSAMRVLKARLCDIRLKEQQSKLDQIGGAKKEIGFGSQIRSYVLHPYQLVKDHRTKFEVGDPNRVLDGDLDPFIKAYLMAKASGTLGQ